MLKSVAMLSVLLLITCLSLAETYHIGPGKKYLNIGDAPLVSLKGGDWVLIFYRDEPYREKWVITAQGSASDPVVFHGVSGDGKLPVDMPDLGKIADGSFQAGQVLPEVDFSAPGWENPHDDPDQG